MPPCDNQGQMNRSVEGPVRRLVGQRSWEPRSYAIRCRWHHDPGRLDVGCEVCSYSATDGCDGFRATLHEGGEAGRRKYQFAKSSPEGRVLRKSTVTLDFPAAAAATDCWRARLLRHEHCNSWRGGLEADETGMNAIHSREVGLGIFLEHAKPGVTPVTSKVDSQPAVSGEGVANPIGTETVLDHDEDSAVVVQVADGNAMTLSGTTPYGFYDECVLAGIGGPWNSRDDRKGRNRVRYSNYEPRKFHGSPRCAVRWSGRAAAWRRPPTVAEAPKVDAEEYQTPIGARCATPPQRLVGR